MIIFVKLPPNSGHFLITDNFLKTLRYPSAIHRFHCITMVQIVFSGILFFKLSIFFFVLFIQVIFGIQKPGTLIYVDTIHLSKIANISFGEWGYNWLNFLDDKNNDKHSAETKNLSWKGKTFNRKEYLSRDKVAVWKK